MSLLVLHILGESTILLSGRSVAGLMRDHLQPAPISASGRCDEFFAGPINAAGSRDQAI